TLFLRTHRGTVVRVDIEKEVEIDLTIDTRPRARTHGYSYSAIIPRSGTLIRYCSPHDDSHIEGSAPHHKFHHKHDFTKGPAGAITLLGDDEWPHVGQLLDEVLGRF